MGRSRGRSPLCRWKRRASPVGWMLHRRGIDWANCVFASRSPSPLGRSARSELLRARGLLHQLHPQENEGESALNDRVGCFSLDENSVFTRNRPPQQTPTLIVWAGSGEGERTVQAVGCLPIPACIFLHFCLPRNLLENLLGGAFALRCSRSHGALMIICIKIDNDLLCPK